MSLKLGNNLVAGLTYKYIYNANEIFDYKWRDTEVSNTAWVSSDGNWISGTTYSTAYNHLVDDYDGATEKSATIGSYTITYYEAVDGHCIILPNMETTLNNIYDESGIAWFYLIDMTNQRFKLPRDKDRKIIEQYINGQERYTVYSDGWCEQGGVVTLIANSWKTVDLYKTYLNTNYACLYSGYDHNYKDDWGTLQAIQAVDESSIRIYTGYDKVENCWWQTKGYITVPTVNNPHKYLQFYLGEEG